jgi:hypothetical protein
MKSGGAPDLPSPRLRAAAAGRHSPLRLSGPSPEDAPRLQPLGQVVVNLDGINYQANNTTTALATPYDGETSRPRSDERDILRLDVATPAMAPKMIIDTERSIEIATLTKSASLIVLLVCGLSLVVGLLSGFNAIHPSVALLLGTAAVIFFIMGVMLAKESARNVS